MHRYELDVEKSKAVYEHCKSRLAMKECYINIFKVVGYYMKNFRACEWRVAYGYMTVFGNVLCRHCFIIDENKNVIDPTIFTHEAALTDREYYAMKIFNDIDVYFEAIKSENYYPSLDRLLKENEAQARVWAEKNGFILTG